MAEDTEGRDKTLSERMFFNMRDYGYFVHTQEIRKDGVVFYLVLDIALDIEFQELVFGCARDIYGDAIPENVKYRIEKELKYIFTSGSASYFMALSRIFRTAGISDWDVAGQGSCGASFVAYLLGINGGINPLADDRLSLDDRFFYGENGDKPRFGMSYDIIHEKIEDIREAISDEKLVKEYTECGIEKFSSGDISKVVLRVMPVKISEALCSIKKQIISSDYKNDFSGFDFGKFNSGMKADEISILMNATGVDLQIPNFICSHYIARCFIDLVWLIALCKGVGVWTEDVQDLILKGKITFDDVPCTRDWVYRLLSGSGMEDAEAFRMTERIRKGKGLLPEQRKELEELQISEWLIEYFDEVKYLPSESDCISSVKKVWAVVCFNKD